MCLILTTGACTRLKANRVTVSELRIILDSQETQRLIADRVNRDATEGRPPFHRTFQRSGEEWGHPEPYVNTHRSQFLQAFANEPSISLPEGIYLQNVETSKAKCFLDPFSTPTFFKVRVLSGRLKGKEGWTCGPTRPVFPDFY
jgi:hypothetical protein